MKLFFLSPSGSYWAVPQHLQAALIGIHFLTLRMTSMISLMSEYLLLCMCGLRLSLCSSTKCECTAVVWAVNKDRCPWCVPKYNPLHLCVLFLHLPSTTQVTWGYIYKRKPCSSVGADQELDEPVVRSWCTHHMCKGKKACTQAALDWMATDHWGTFLEHIFQLYPKYALPYSMTAQQEHGQRG